MLQVNSAYTVHMCIILYVYMYVIHVKRISMYLEHMHNSVQESGRQADDGEIYKTEHR